MGRGLAFQVVLRGADIDMPHAFLDIVGLVTGLFEPMDKGGAQGVGGDALGDAGGTDNHLMLVDLSVLGSDAHGNEITGKLVEKALDRGGIHCIKNMIPFDKKPALTTSGIRPGTPEATT